MMSEDGYRKLINSETGENLYWTADMDVELPVKLDQSGRGSKPPITMCDGFLQTSHRFADRLAI